MSCYVHKGQVRNLLMMISYILGTKEAYARRAEEDQAQVL